MQKHRFIVTLIGIFAILTALGGYTGLFQKMFGDPYREFKDEFYFIVDKAQLWYSRPDVYGGGGKSFIDFDFQRIGLSDKPGSITYNGQHGKFFITQLRSQSFDLEGIAFDSTEFGMKRIRFDTRPHLE